MEKLLFEYPEECITEHVPDSSSLDGSIIGPNDGDVPIRTTRQHQAKTIFLFQI